MTLRGVTSTAMNIALRQFELPTSRPFTTSRATVTRQRTLIVSLEQGGMFGFGEAPEAAYYGASIERMLEAIEQVRPTLENVRLDDPTELWAELPWPRGGTDSDPQASAVSFARCAVDCAAHDLWGKLRGRPVWKLWGLDLSDAPPSDYTIGIDSLENRIAHLRERADWPIFKIKLGIDDDLQHVRALRAESDSVFRVDANCAWEVEETLHKAEALRELGVEYVEQPLPPQRDDDMPRLMRESALPLIADESCQVEADVDRCAGRFHGVNVKLVKCGGLTPARRMLARAEELGLRTMVGCFTESTVGISAVAQLLPLVDYADVDGAALLAEDVADGVAVVGGEVRFPEANGCGVQMLR